MKKVQMEVTYIDHMGGDINVVNAARVSFGKEVQQMTDSDVKLIKYLATHGHWTPLAHTSISIRVKAPLFIASQYKKHCVTGDTEITCVKLVKGVSNGLVKYTIKDLFEMWEGKIKYQGGNKGKRNVSGHHIRVFNEVTNRFETSSIEDVLYQGEKQVYNVSTLHGQMLKITEDHKVFTKRGWVSVSDLVVNVDSLLSEQSGENIDSRYKRDNDSEDVICRREHKKTKCVKCSSTENLECDHIIPVQLGGTHSADNLQTLCKSCHNKKTYTEKTCTTTLVPMWTKVTSIDKLGVEKVYDLTVKGIHNFLANGLVIHNCVGLVWNEVSRRYVSTEPEFYLPDVWRGRPQGSIKQGSAGTVDSSLLKIYEDTAHDVAVYTPEGVVELALNMYNKMLEAGVAPEQARMILPQCTMTEWIWTGSAVAFDRIIKQRIGHGAQQEAGDLAEMIKAVVVPCYPSTFEALFSLH